MLVHWEPSLERAIITLWRYSYTYHGMCFAGTPTVTPAALYLHPRERIRQTGTECEGEYETKGGQMCPQMQSLCACAKS